jgi:molybdate transport system substrate-binding protein
MIVFLSLADWAKQMSLAKARNFLIRVLVLLLTASATAGCGKQPLAPIILGTGDDPLTTVPHGAQQHAQLVVFAAASLTGALQEIGKAFEAANPGVGVSFNFAGSQILRTQLELGASADVFASADHQNMDVLAADGLVIPAGIQQFARNRLVVILPTDNPAGIEQLVDIARPGVKVILADASVPAGNYARQVLDKISQNPAYNEGFSQKVLANLVSNETDVKQVVAKVELGEADAGIVYISDAVAAPQLKTIPIPDELNVTASYPVAVLQGAHEPLLAQAFVAYVLSPAGQAVLEKWGFMGAQP